MAAYKLYEAGMSVPRIAKKIWEKKGYASKEACQNSLYYSFASYKLRVRNCGNAKWLMKTCAGCDGDLDKKDHNCRHCRDRFRRRAERKEQRQKDLIKERRLRKECITCGVPQTEHTLGCTTCNERHSKRNRREDPVYGEKRRAYDREYNKKRPERIAA